MKRVGVERADLGNERVTCAMGLRERLERQFGGVEKKRDEIPDPRREALRKRLERILSMVRSVQIAEKVEGTPRKMPPLAKGFEDLYQCPPTPTPFGEALVIREEIPSAFTFMGEPVTAFATRRQSTLALMANDMALEKIPPARALFLDIETTGVSTGAGDMAFLIGMAFASPHGLSVRQFFLRDPSEEKAVIHLLESEIPKPGFIVTYNGKSFDIPVLSSRFALHRSPFPYDDLPHLDLLGPVRRIWRKRLRSVTLTNVERRVFFCEREDVPSSLIPSLYLSFLRHRETKNMASLLGHNRLDLLSMTALLNRIALLVEDPERIERVEDLLSMARLLMERGEREKALQCLEKAERETRTPEQAYIVRKTRARLLEKMGRKKEALTGWKEALCSQPFFDPLPFLRSSSILVSFGKKEEARELLERGVAAAGSLLRGEALRKKLARITLPRPRRGKKT